MYQSTRSVIADLLEDLGQLGSAETLRYADDFDPSDDNNCCDEYEDLEDPDCHLEEIVDVLDEVEIGSATPEDAIKRIRGIVT